jgi:hypothetical protein
VPDDPVAAAARRTLAAGTARVWGGSYWVGAPVDERSATKWPRTAGAFQDGLQTERRGVVDLGARRAYVQHRVALLDAAVLDLLDRWPWLLGGDDDDEDEDDELDSWSEQLEVGARVETSSYTPDPGWPARDPQSYSAWILDGLTGANGSRRLEEETVRDGSTVRYGFLADLRVADVTNLARPRSPRITGWRREWKRKQAQPEVETGPSAPTR